MITDSENMKQTNANIAEYTVSEISGALKRTVEDRFGYVRVRAELSGVKRVSSGHCYFALKDESSVLDGVMWRGNVSRLSFVPEDGLEVVCSGKLTTYAARSKYQMVVDAMEPAGAGALMALLEERKQKLASEGLFDPSRKVPIPFLPRKIGVVTSPTGAVIRDILHRLSDRFPSNVMVWPVLVQGEGAAEQVSQAIAGFNAMENGRPDLLIVARGGGSIEDLWSFNEEVVVRAVAASQIPLISAVGHETDTTLIDYAADLRAPTPTAAAEKAVPVKVDLEFSLTDLGRRLSVQKTKMLEDRKQAIVALARALPKPKDILGMNSQKLDDLSERLPMALLNSTRQKSILLGRLSGSLSSGKLQQAARFNRERLLSASSRLRPISARLLTEKKDRILVAARMLASLSYQNVLNRGFAMVKNDSGNIVKTHEGLKIGDKGEIVFASGSVAFETSSGMNEATANMPKRTSEKPRPKKPNKVNSKVDTNQGSLF
ncbi:exodeoxyribonuclease VII large subunit [Kordiimonas sp. SCSIO 12610]|uniref:exodeoxyribonuclease VII large subunit n=1 Tax=Kordiimonas sp. SCSIO 12610 TaxID=2829597 RepID=UPI00210A0F8A|nr:exodeoxyribonuclease VII large subunit [Kordiimonas sp. SCSIO 12610]UTW54876.1 exodeoxyribonuclease VII large subunit [Kordiimonas sp. SCSIO 12610]